MGTVDFRRTVPAILESYYMALSIPLTKVPFVSGHIV